MSLVSDLLYRAGYFLPGVVFVITAVGLITIGNGRSDFMNPHASAATLGIVCILFGLHNAVFRQRLSDDVFRYRERLVARHAWLRVMFKDRLESWHCLVGGIVIAMFGLLLFRLP